jgi:hypothetical protein
VLQCRATPDMGRQAGIGQQGDNCPVSPRFPKVGVFECPASAAPTSSMQALVLIFTRVSAFVGSEFAVSNYRISAPSARVLVSNAMAKVEGFCGFERERISEFMTRLITV